MSVVAAFAYPWDILGDPQAPGQLRDLGADTVVLAAAYHSTTALTPRNPGHRVVHAALVELRRRRLEVPSPAARFAAVAVTADQQERGAAEEDCGGSWVTHSGLHETTLAPENSRPSGWCGLTDYI